MSGMTGGCKTQNKIAPIIGFLYSLVCFALLNVFCVLLRVVL
jgi:hypothetical protein